jgi:hypothetical protein
MANSCTSRKIILQKMDLHGLSGRSSVDFVSHPNRADANATPKQVTAKLPVSAICRGLHDPHYRSLFEIELSRSIPSANIVFS